MKQRTTIMRRIFRAVLAALIAIPAAAVVAAETATVPALTPALRTQLAALPHLRGAPVGPETFEGKVVVVTFFASWCPPCRVEFKHLNAIHETYGERGVEILAINLFEDWDGLSDAAKLRRFLARTAPRFSIVEGDAATGLAFGDVQRIPTLFIFDRGGRSALYFIHELDAEKTHLELEELEAAIEPLL